MRKNFILALICGIGFCFLATAKALREARKSKSSHVDEPATGTENQYQGTKTPHPVINKASKIV